MLAAPTQPELEHKQVRISNTTTANKKISPP